MQLTIHPRAYVCVVFAYNNAGLYMFWGVPQPNIALVLVIVMILAKKRKNGIFHRNFTIAVHSNIQCQLFLVQRSIVNVFYTTTRVNSFKSSRFVGVRSKVNGKTVNIHIAPLVVRVSIKRTLHSSNTANTVCTQCAMFLCFYSFSFSIQRSLTSLYIVTLTCDANKCVLLLLVLAFES